jgi:hypothetical protein
MCSRCDVSSFKTFNENCIVKRIYTNRHPETVSGKKKQYNTSALTVIFILKTLGINYPSLLKANMGIPM